MDQDDQIARAIRVTRGSPFFHTDQAAADLKMSTRLPKPLRTDGSGPAFWRQSRLVRHHIDGLDAWSVAHAPRAISQG